MKNIIFPVSISESDFDSNSETSHGGGVIFEKGILNENGSEIYTFDIFGKQYTGFVVEDFQISHIISRLEYPRLDIRQMKIYVPEAPTKRFINISYYVLDNKTRECIFVLCRR